MDVRTDCVKNNVYVRISIKAARRGVPGSMLPNWFDSHYVRT